MTANSKFLELKQLDDTSKLLIAYRLVNGRTNFFFFATFGGYLTSLFMLVALSQGPLETEAWVRYLIFLVAAVVVGLACWRWVAVRGEKKQVLSKMLAHQPLTTEVIRTSLAPKAIKSYHRWSFLTLFAVMLGWFYAVSGSFLLQSISQNAVDAEYVEGGIRNLIIGAVLIAVAVPLKFVTDRSGKKIHAMVTEVDASEKEEETV